MKKVILVVLSGFACLMYVKAQTTKGDLFIGASIGSTSYSSVDQNYNYADGNYTKDNVKGYNISLSPSVGVFLSDYFIVGGNLGLNYTQEQVNENNTEAVVITSSSTTIASMFGIGPFMRYYFFNGRLSKTLFYVQADGSVSTGSGSSSVLGTNSAGSYISNGNMSHIFNYSGGGSIGITHFIEKNIGLDLSVGYVYDHKTYTDNIVTSSTGTGVTVVSSTTVSSRNNGIAIAAGFHFIIQ